jgi:hypothetical protein
MAMNSIPYDYGEFYIGGYRETTLSCLDHLVFAQHNKCATNKEFLSLFVIVQCVFVLVM